MMTQEQLIRVRIFSLRIFITLAVIAFCFALAQSKRCGERADMMGTDSHYDIWTGCMVKVDSGEWVPLGNVRVNEWGEELGDE